jgi:hypothetical protein
MSQNPGGRMLRGTWKHCASFVHVLAVCCVKMNVTAILVAMERLRGGKWGCMLQLVGRLGLEVCTAESSILMHQPHAYV